MSPPPHSKRLEDSGLEGDGEVHSPPTVQGLVEVVETAEGGRSEEPTSASKRSPRGGQARKDKAKMYTLPPELEGMAEIATEFQKAVVSGLVQKYIHTYVRTFWSL